MPPPVIRSVFVCLAAFALGLPSAFAQTTERVSVDSAGVQANNQSYTTSISDDGRYVAFVSLANNLVPGDTNNQPDIFVHDRQSGLTARVSVDSSGMQGGSFSDYPSLSADGRFVAFDSFASNLVPGDTNNETDVFVHDRMTGQTSRVSVDSQGSQVSGASAFPTISADGRYVGFMSTSSNLVTGDTNGSADVFAHDRLTGQTTRVSVDSNGGQGDSFSNYPSLSSDGRFVVFESSATNLVTGDTNLSYDVFVHDQQTGQTTRASVDSAGSQGNASSAQGSCSANGRFVAFSSFATNLVPGDSNSTPDIFLHDRNSGMTTRVSLDSAGIQGNGQSYGSDLSSDGRFVAIVSSASNLVAGDVNTTQDVFIHDRQTGQTSLVSLDSAGAQANGPSRRASVSADGRFVAFNSSASNLVPGDTNNVEDACVRDRGASGPSLTINGTCPGQVNLTINNATASGVVAIVYGAAGNFVKPNQPCQGLTISLSSPKLLAWWTADLAGVVSLNFNAPPRACGLSVQAVDVTTCVATNVIVL